MVQFKDDDNCDFLFNLFLYLIIEINIFILLKFKTDSIIDIIILISNFINLLISISLLYILLKDVYFNNSNNGQSNFNQSFCKLINSFGIITVFIFSFIFIMYKI